MMGINAHCYQTAPVRQKFPEPIWKDMVMGIDYYDSYLSYNNSPGKCRDISEIFAPINLCMINH